jgi:hypothetical protein
LKLYAFLKKKFFFLQCLNKHCKNSPPPPPAFVFEDLSKNINNLIPAKPSRCFTVFIVLVLLKACDLETTRSTFTIWNNEYRSECLGPCDLNI